MSAPALLVAGTHSGCGKTTVTLGLMAALKRRGLEVRPFKCGPDFIDPSLHEMVCGRVSRNLDCRMCGEDFVRATFARHNPPGSSTANSVAVVEGVMGLFDGGAGSAAHLAKVLGLPVMLVLDVRSAAESVAALAHGFATFDPDLPLAGIIGNRVGSARHEALIREAMRRVETPLVGFLPREEAIAVPSRHLGLHMGGEAPLDAAALDRLAEMMERHLDLDGLLETAKTAILRSLPSFRGEGAGMGGTEVDVASAPHPQPLPPQAEGGELRRAAPFKTRIAIARDAAFCFYYEDNLDMLREAGAELAPFSPLADAALPEGASGLYLGGGYPELHAARLAENAAMRATVRAFCAAGRPVFAECGGFMYLCERLRDLDGREHPMCGVFPRVCVMRPKLRALGYREAVLPNNTFFGPAGTRLFGHEFHYSELLPAEDASNEARETDSEYFLQSGNTLAGYLHLHWGRTPEAPAAFVQACRAVQP